MRINTNVASLQAQESAINTSSSLNSSLEKLSTGLRINKASDDASGLAIADKLRTQASSLNQAVANGNSATALTQIADKAMAEISNIIDIIKQKTIQAATDTTSSSGKSAIEQDIKKLLSQIDNITTQTNYNGKKLLNADASLSFQMGETATDKIEVTFSDVSSSGLGIDGVTGTTADLSKLDDALTSLNTSRSKVGSGQNQLESSVRNLMTAVTNIKNAESVIRDVDYAQESANFNKQNVISQAGTYAISQANNVNQNVLKLLQ
jgi:flagellin